MPVSDSPLVSRSDSALTAARSVTNAGSNTLTGDIVKVLPGISVQAVRETLQKAESIKLGKFTPAALQAYAVLVTEKLKEIQQTDMSVALAEKQRKEQNNPLFPADRAQALKESLACNAGADGAASKQWRIDTQKEIDILTSLDAKNIAGRKIGEKYRPSIAYARLEDPDHPGYVRAYVTVTSKTDTGVQHQDIQQSPDGMLNPFGNMLRLGLGTPYRALTLLTSHKIKGAEAPLIRSFLVDKKFLEQHLPNLQTKMQNTRQPPLINVDRHEINQFDIKVFNTINGEKKTTDLMQSLISQVKPGSLQTIGYSQSQASHDPVKEGEFVDVATFSQKLGLSSDYGPDSLFSRMVIKGGRGSGKVRLRTPAELKLKVDQWEKFFHKLESLDSDETKRRLADMEVRKRFDSMLRELLTMYDLAPEKIIELKDEAPHSAPCEAPRSSKEFPASIAPKNASPALRKPASVRATTHPRPDNAGNTVIIKSPTRPSDSSTWADSKRIASFVPDGAYPDSLNNISMTPWRPPTTPAGWEKIANQNGNLIEPEIDAGIQKAGVLIVEPDGRHWIIETTNHFAKGAHTFARGPAEEGLSLQAAAIKAAYEQTGLQVELVAYVTDFTLLKGHPATRYYLARRVGGTPAEMGWKTQGVHLIPHNLMMKTLATNRDKTAFVDGKKMILVDKLGTSDHQSGLFVALRQQAGCRRDNPRFIKDVEGALIDTVPTAAATQVYAPDGTPLPANRVQVNGASVAIVSQYPTNKLLPSYLRMLAGNRTPVLVVLASQRDLHEAREASDVQEDSALSSYFSQSGEYKDVKVMVKDGQPYALPGGLHVQPYTLEITEKGIDGTSTALESIPVLHVLNWMNHSSLEADALKALVENVDAAIHQTMNTCEQLGRRALKEQNQALMVVHDFRSVGRAATLLAARALMDGTAWSLESIISDMRRSSNHRMVDTTVQMISLADFASEQGRPILQIEEAGPTTS